MGVWDKREAEKAGRKSVFDRLDEEKSLRRSKFDRWNDEPKAETGKSDETLRQYEKDVEEAIESEAKYLSRKIKEQSARLGTVTSDGYWFAVYFNNDAQKREFLEKLGFNKTDVYINGRDFARVINQKIEKPDFDFGEEKKPIQDYKDRARKAKNQN